MATKSDFAFGQEPVLIRAWGRNWKQIGHCIAIFDRGFYVPHDHAIVEALKANWLDAQLTVLSTDQVLWNVESLELGAFHCPFADEVRVSCIPHVELARRTLRSDEWFLENLKWAAE